MSQARTKARERRAVIWEDAKRKLLEDVRRELSLTADEAKRVRLRRGEMDRTYVRSLGDSRRWLYHTYGGGPSFSVWRSGRLAIWAG